PRHRRGRHQEGPGVRGAGGSRRGPTRGTRLRRRDYGGGSDRRGRAGCGHRPGGGGGVGAMSVRGTTSGPRESAVIRAPHVGGEVLPTDALPVGAGRLAITRRFPLSPIVGITPFNFPVLLAAHKIAPAMACGAAITLKPPPQDPLTTLRLAEIIGASGYPAGGVNVVPCHVEVAQLLIEDPRVRMISFTGSAKAGWA